MNLLRFLSLACVLSSIAIATPPIVDDPPPEPVDCPLCGGDPALHARRMFDVARVGGAVVSNSLRW